MKFSNNQHNHRAQGATHYFVDGGLGGAEVASTSRESLCHERLPHCGHFMKDKVRGCPAAFQRMPPNSQMDRAQPHEHRIIHKRDSASMLSAHLRGRMRTQNFCRDDIIVARHRTDIRPPVVGQMSVNFHHSRLPSGCVKARKKLYYVLIKVLRGVSGCFAP